MVKLNIGGQKVSWADAEKLFAEMASKGRVEFRDENGLLMATSFPEPGGSWEDQITPEETARRLAQPGYTFEEAKKMLGWE